jgi:hypothetical protein
MAFGDGLKWVRTSVGLGFDSETPVFVRFLKRGRETKVLDELTGLRMD